MFLFASEGPEMTLSHIFLMPVCLKMANPKLPCFPRSCGTFSELFVSLLMSLPRRRSCLFLEGILCAVVWKGNPKENTYPKAPDVFWALKMGFWRGCVESPKEHTNLRPWLTCPLAQARSGWRSMRLRPSLPTAAWMCWRCRPKQAEQWSQNNGHG